MLRADSDLGTDPRSYVMAEVLLLSSSFVMSVLFSFFFSFSICDKSFAYTKRRETRRIQHRVDCTSPGQMEDDTPVTL